MLVRALPVTQPKPTKTTLITDTHQRKMASPQLQQWFQLADTDRDGRIGGKEAVQFFTKSGLPQDTLGHVSL